MRIDTMERTTGTLDGFTPATIDDDDMPVAMQLFSANYTLQKDAVIRELVANALDAQSDAGVTIPVQVQLPTWENPWLVISDQGTGLSACDMVDVYGKFVKSTKRDNPLRIGGMGIGAKAPHAVADQYTVEAVQDGKLATALFAKVDGVPAHKIISEVDTDQPNGVKITIPVDLDNTMSEWTRAAERVHFWMDEDAVRFTGFDPNTRPASYPSYHDVLYPEQTEQAVALRDNRLNHAPVETASYVKMGPVGYKIPSQILPAQVSYRHTLMLYTLPIGACEISPSRESITASEHNRKILEQAHQTWQEEIFAPLMATYGALGSGYEKHQLFKKQFGDSSPSHMPGLKELGGPGDIFFRIPGVQEVTPTSIRRQHIVGLFVGNEDLGANVYFDLDNAPSSLVGKCQAWSKSEGVKLIMISRSAFEKHQSYAGYFGDYELEWLSNDDLRETTREVRTSSPAGPPISQRTFEGYDCYTGQSLGDLSIEEAVAWLDEHEDYRVYPASLTGLHKLSHTTRHSGPGRLYWHLRAEDLLEMDRISAKVLYLNTGTGGGQVVTEIDKQLAARGEKIPRTITAKQVNWDFIEQIHVKALDKSDLQRIADVTHFTKKPIHFSAMHQLLTELADRDDLTVKSRKSVDRLTQLFVQDRSLDRLNKVDYAYLNRRAHRLEQPAQPSAWLQKLDRTRLLITMMADNRIYPGNAGVDLLKAALDADLRG